MENKKRKICKCEICGKNTKEFTLNMCEKCFDKGANRHYQRSRKDLEWKWKAYRKLKKN